MNETLSTMDGHPVLRMERRLAHPPERVWRALTDPAELSLWYPLRAVTIDDTVGGVITFADEDGTPYEARITEYEPHRRFAFHVVEPGTPGGLESDNRVRFELLDDPAGCLLIFTHLFADRPAAASYTAGWRGCLDIMETVLAGGAVQPPDPATMLAEHEAFVYRFGLDRGTAEPDGDGWRVRFERQLMMREIDALWTALAGEGSEPKPGNPVPAGFTAPTIPSGPVTAVEPPTLLEYEVPHGLIRWELVEGPGGARIVLTQTGHADAERERALTAWRDRIAEIAKR